LPGDSPIRSNPPAGRPDRESRTLTQRSTDMPNAIPLRLTRQPDTVEAQGPAGNADMVSALSEAQSSGAAPNTRIRALVRYRPKWRGLQLPGPGVTSPYRYHGTSGQRSSRLNCRISGDHGMQITSSGPTEIRGWPVELTRSGRDVPQPCTQ
jgi:hypothetical protein